MNGGAVIADRSPVKPANLRGIRFLINVSHQTNADGHSRLQKARPVRQLVTYNPEPQERKARKKSSNGQGAS
jgi:hypothetical protein